MKYYVEIFEANMYHGDFLEDVKEFRTEAAARAFVKKFNPPGEIKNGDKVAHFVENDDEDN
jgi:hypothetical protein